MSCIDSCTESVSSPLKQTCFQFRMERGPGRAHLQRVHGNSAAAAHSQHPIMHRFHHRWMSRSLTQSDKRRKWRGLEKSFEKLQRKIVKNGLFCCENHQVTGTPNQERTWSNAFSVKNRCEGWVLHNCCWNLTEINLTEMSKTKIARKPDKMSKACNRSLKMSKTVAKS